MKATILSLLPIVGFAAADSVCQLKTITKTEYAYAQDTPVPVASSAPVVSSVVAAAVPYVPEAASTPVVSSQAVVVKQNATPLPTTCSRSTVTTTKVEKVTVTVEAGEEPVSTIDITRTSTVYSKTTVTVHPSKASSAAVQSSKASSAAVQPSKASSAAVPAVSSKAAVTSSKASSSATSALPDFTLANSANAQPAPSASSAPSSAPPKQTEQAQGSETSAAGSKHGEATFYGGNVAGGMCSFTGYTVPDSLFGTALSDSNWAGAQACGQCVKVTGPDGNQITAMVVDQCPGCGNNHLDLFPDAFKKLADPSKGVINVSWDFVPCGITSPIVLKNKEGTSKFWFSMQVMNANVGVSKLEVSTDGGSSWKATTRQPYNFFENSSGFGADTVDVKVTSIDGKSIIVKGVSIAASSTKTAGSNF